MSLRPFRPFTPDEQPLRSDIGHIGIFRLLAENGTPLHHGVGYTRLMWAEVLTRSDGRWNPLMWASWSPFYWQRLTRRGWRNVWGRPGLPPGAGIG